MFGCGFLKPTSFSTILLQQFFALILRINSSSISLSQRIFLSTIFFHNKIFDDVKIMGIS